MCEQVVIVGLKGVERVYSSRNNPEGGCEARNLNHDQPLQDDEEEEPEAGDVAAF